MQQRVFSVVPVLAAAGAAVLLAGCATSGGASGGGTPPKPAVLTAKDAVRLASQTARNANSFTGTSTIVIKALTGTAKITANFTEQLHPSLLAQVNLSSFQVPGLPSGVSMSGMEEILTPSALYLKWSYLSTALHTSKQWIKIPLSALSSKSGVNFSSIFNQISNNGPLTQDKMLAGATNVRTVGTGTVDGVPVTEYTGTVSMAKALAVLDAGTRSTLSQALSEAGISSARFTIWIDGQHLVRKSVVTESGSAMSEVITTTVTSINQPVSVQVPADSQVVSPPAGALG